MPCIEQSLGECLFHKMPYSIFSVASNPLHRKRIVTRTIFLLRPFFAFAIIVERVHTAQQGAKARQVAPHASHTDRSGPSASPPASPLGLLFWDQADGTSATPSVWKHFASALGGGDVERGMLLHRGRRILLLGKGRVVVDVSSFLLHLTVQVNGMD